MAQVSQPSSEFALAKKQIILGLAAVFALYFSSTYFVQTFTIARPRMAADLNGMSLYAWLISIPSLAAAFVTLLFAKLSDMYGRRIMLLISLSFFLIGTILCALSPTFPLLIWASTISRIGSGGLVPVCYAVLGDMYDAAERSKWVGLLNIPRGIFALFGPMLGGWFVDNLSWRHLYWIGAPLILLCFLLVPVGVPAGIRKAASKIDVRGAILVAIASSATILGLSFAGTTYPWISVQVIGLLSIGLLFWIVFFRAEGKADEPIMDPQVFRNRTFLTVAVSGMMSFFGLMAISMYYPIYLQGVQGVSAMMSGQILTPYNVLVAFIGVPTGFILAKTKRYKWLYIFSYGLLTLVLTGITFFDARTPLFIELLSTTLVGLGLGAIPTVNTLVVQYIVPKRLLGVSLGAIFFSIQMGMAIAPAVLGSIMNISYAAKLEKTLPGELKQFVNTKTMAALGDSKALLSPKGMKELETTFNKTGRNELFKKTVEAIRASMLEGVRSVFIFGAATMLISFLLILTVPEVSMDAVVEDKKAQPTAAAEAKSS